MLAKLNVLGSPELIIIGLNIRLECTVHRAREFTVLVHTAAVTVHWMSEEAKHDQNISPYWALWDLLDIN